MQRKTVTSTALVVKCSQEDCVYEAAPTYADLKCNWLTLLALHLWLTVRVACGMLDQRQYLAAKGYSLRLCNPGQSRRKLPVIT